MSNLLAELVSPDEYVADRQAFFPSRLSFDWQVRTHRRELLRAGALLVVNGRRMVNPPVFDQVLIEAAQRRAAEELDGQP